MDEEQRDRISKKFSIHRFQILKMPHCCVNKHKKFLFFMQIGAVGDAVGTVFRGYNSCLSISLRAL